MKRFSEWAGQHKLAVETIDITAGRSRASRFGKRAIVAAFLIDALEPVLSVLGVLLLTSVPAMAQGGGRARSSGRINQWCRTPSGRP